MKNLLKKLHTISGITVEKDKTNPHYGNKYASLDAIVNALTPILQKNNLVVTHALSEWLLVTTVYDMESEESLSSSFPINALEPQKAGSAITYGKRYSLAALFNIVSDDDDDATLASTQKQAPAPAKSNYWF